MISILLIGAYWIGNLVRMPLVQNVEVPFIDLAVGLILLRYVPYFISHWKTLLKQRLFQCTLFFLFVALTSLIVHASSLGFTPAFASSLYIIRLALYMSMLFIPLHISTRHIYGLIAGFTFIGLAQYVLYPNLRNLFYLGWDDHYLRLFGSLLDPNFTGVLCVLMIMTLLHELEKKMPSRQQRMIYLLLTLTGIALLLTYSRSAYLIFLVGMSAYGVARKKFALIGIVFLVFLGGLLVIPKNLPSEGVDLFRMASINARQKEYVRAATIIKDNPLLGVGYNAYRYAQIQYGFEQPGIFPSHGAAGVPNSYLFILATTGIIGLLSFFLWLGALWQKYRATSSLAFPLLAAYLASGSFDNTLVYPFIMLWVFLMLKQAEFPHKRRHDEQSHQKIRDTK